MPLHILWPHQYCQCIEIWFLEQYLGNPNVKIHTSLSLCPADADSLGTSHWHISHSKEGKVDQIHLLPPNTIYSISRCMRLNLMPHAANTRYHIPMYCGCYKMLGKTNTFPKKVNIHPQLANISRCGGSSQFRQCQDLVSAYYCNPFLYLCHTLRGVVSRNDSRGQCVSHLCIW